SNIGERLKAVEHFVAEDSIFLANYSDGLTDFPLPRLIEEFKLRQAVGMFLSVRPNYSGHFVRRDHAGRLLPVGDVANTHDWNDGGYFVFSREIFKYIEPGEELVERPFERLIDSGKLFALDYEGFWRCADTFKDLQALESLISRGRPPWAVWSSG